MCEYFLKTAKVAKKCAKECFFYDHSLKIASLFAS